MGKVVQVIGPVLDIRFEDGHLPELLNAIEIMNGDRKITAEVAQHIGDNVARCISMNATDGMVRGLEEGSTVVTVVYADPLGNEFRRVLNVRSTFFPFGAEYISTSLFSQGTYNEKTRNFKFGQYGQMGWEYPSGADMSGYKYLVLKLKRITTTAHINLFTSGSIWGDCCATPDFGSKKQIVLDLTTAKYTSGDRTGEPLDTKNIRIVSFWCNNANIIVDDMYLTNNDDYSREENPDAIRFMEASPAIVDIYSVNGVCVRRNVSIGQELQNLPAGIYIIGRKKYVRR
jgi:hypothetical protein